MSHRVDFLYVDADGNGIGSATTKWVTATDKDTGAMFDFDDAAWEAAGTAPTTRQGTLSEDGNETGLYYYTFDESGWSNRRVEYTLFLLKDPNAGQVHFEERVFILGELAVPVYTPSPAAGTISLVYYTRTGAGAKPSTTPTGYAYVVDGPGTVGVDNGPVAGTYDGTAGALSWTVPQNCDVVRIVVPDYGEYSYWTTEEAQIIHNTNTGNLIKRL